MSFAGTYVSAPALTPTPYGLLTVAEARPSEDPHWRQGVVWRDICPGTMGGTTYDGCALTDSSPDDKAQTTSFSLFGARAFTAFAEIDCSPVDFYGEGEQRAIEALNKTETWQVERAFWTGTVGGDSYVYPRLAANAVVQDTLEARIRLQMAAAPVTGTSIALDVVEGLGRLERAMANCLNGVGVIHVTTDVAEHLIANMVAIVKGPRLVTVNGNVIVVGAGYPGTGPDGAAPPAGQSWMYGTGPLFSYKSDVKVYAAPHDSMVRTINTLKMIAERTYLIGYGCCLNAVLISTGGIITGAVNSAT